MKRVAICLGLTRVDPAGYDGWNGECPGCDVDAAAFATLCHAKGFDGVHVLLNSMADDMFLLPAFQNVVDTLRADDLLILYFSGHGGQEPDSDDDELDGLDETLCLWSRQLLDDDIAAYLSEIPAGVRVLMVTDSCHSGTNFRSRRPLQLSQPVSLERSASNIECSLLHFGGCSDERYSYGDEDGGIFTSALVKVAKRSRKPLTYRQWFERAAKLMPAYQTPTIAIWGEETFENREMLT